MLTSVLALVTLLSATESLAVPVSAATAEEAAVRWIAHAKGTPVDPAAVRWSWSADYGDVTAYHVVNFEGGGWVVIAGDDVAIPVLA